MGNIQIKGLSKLVAASNVIPFDTQNVFMTRQTLSSNLVFAANLGLPDTELGNGAIIELKGDGSHTPDLTAFTVVSGTFDPTLNKVNILTMMYLGGTDIVVSISQRPGLAAGNVTPPAPTNGVVDDSTNTFTFTPAVGYSATQHEYRYNGGAWTTCSSNSINLGNIAIAIGALELRVMASTGVNAGPVLTNTVAFTVAGGGNVTPPAPTGGVIDGNLHTYTFTLALGYSATQHEYSLDGGTTWQPCTSTTINLGNFYFAVGSILVRVAAASGINTSPSLSNAAAHLYKLLTPVVSIGTVGNAGELVVNITDPNTSPNNESSVDIAQGPDNNPANIASSVNLPPNTTSNTFPGLGAGTTRFGFGRAKGNGTTRADSNWAYASGLVIAAAGPSLIAITPDSGWTTQSAGAFTGNGAGLTSFNGGVKIASGQSGYLLAQVGGSNVGGQNVSEYATGSTIYGFNDDGTELVYSDPDFYGFFWGDNSHELQGIVAGVFQPTGVILNQGNLVRARIADNGNGTNNCILEYSTNNGAAWLASGINLWVNMPNRDNFLQLESLGVKWMVYPKAYNVQ